MPEPSFDWESYLEQHSPSAAPETALPQGSYDWESQLRSIAPGTMALGSAAASAAPQSEQNSWSFPKQFSSGLALGFGPELQGTENYLRAPPGSPLSLEQQIYNARQAKTGFQAQYPVAAQATEIAGSLPTLAITNELTGPAALMRSTSGLARFAGAAASGAEAGALQTGITGGDPGENALTGATTGLLVPAAGKLVKSALLPAVDPNVLNTARELESLGVNVRPSQIAMSSVMRWADEKMASGGNEQQLRDFTRAVSHTFGADTDNLTPLEMARAEGMIGHRMDAVSAQTRITLDQPLNSGMASIGANLRGLPSASQQQVREAISDVRKSFIKGQMDGKTYQRLTQKGGVLMNLSRDSNPDVRLAGGRLRELLDDAVGRYSPAGTQDEWNETRAMRKNLAAVQPLMEKAQPSGILDPALLQQQVRQHFAEYGWVTPSDLMTLGEGGKLLPRPTAFGEAANRRQRDPYMRFGLGTGLGIGLGGEYLYNLNPKTAAIAAGVIGATVAGEKAIGAGLRSSGYRNWLLETRPPWTAGGALPNALTGAVNELKNQKESDN